MATAVRALTAAETAQAELDAYLALNQRKSLLRFLTCGSVDDGKSTLIGRLLYDSKMLFEDQLSALERDSRKFGTQGEAPDLALLVDGLAAEREQGITIDVAYRFFATDKRKFIVADSPGHEQYTRNMVTGASTADLAVILIDARKGVLTQTRRHSIIVNLLGLRHVVLAVNKMDLVGYDQARFCTIVDDYAAFAREIGLAEFTAIPMSGLAGENVTRRSDAMPWYAGPTLLEHLEAVPTGRASADAAPFRMAVQWVNRPNSGFRGYAGMIASGTVRPGDRVSVLPAGRSATVERIVSFDGDLSEASAGRSVTLTFAEEVDCSRGDLIAGAETPSADKIEATLVWMDEQALVPQRPYWLKIGTRTVSARIAAVRSVLDVNTAEQRRGHTLALNDIGTVELELETAVAATPYAENRQLGGFVLIDRESNATIAAGLVRSLAEKPAAQHDEAGEIFWLTGGTLAEREKAAETLRRRLKLLGKPSLLIDEAGLETLAVAGSVERLHHARAVATLASASGIAAVLALDVAEDEAQPGQALDIHDATIEPGGDWVI